MRRGLKWLAGLAAATGIGALLIWAFLEGRAELERERERELPVKTPPRVVRTAGGGTVVALDRETQERIGLADVALAAASWSPEAAGYGTLEADPEGEFVLRAPVSGTLRAAAGSAWPRLGVQLADGATIGRLEPRLGPAERLDVALRLAAARADAEAGTAAVAAARSARDRAQALNADGKNVSDRAVQEAEAKLQAEEARLRAAAEIVRTCESVLAEPGGTPAAGGGGPGGTGLPGAAALPLTLGRGGEVVELGARPGETVAAGQAILRVARFDRLFVRAWFPAGSDPAPRAASVAQAGREDRRLPAEVLGPAPVEATQAPGASLLVSVSAGDSGLRPGMPVTTYVRAPGAAVAGVLVPRAAAVRFGGLVWTYVRVGPDRFQRRELDIGRIQAAGYFADHGFAAGDRVVTTGAQALLSEELKSQIKVGEEEEGK